MGRWGHTATMITESTMMVLGGQADDDAHQATLGDLYKFDFGRSGWFGLGGAGVWAIGACFGLVFSVCAEIVFSKDRSVEQEGAQGWVGLG